MRITGGKFRGRKFLAPKTWKIRPTTDRAREGIFSALGCRLDFEKSQMLDLFSGSGVMSAEFLSRGGKCVLSVDQRQNISEHYRTQIKNFDLGSCWKFESVDLFSNQAIRVIEKHSGVFLDGEINLIFADPPYALFEKMASFFTSFRKFSLVTQETIFCFEHATRYSVNFPFFEKLASYKYGDTSFSLLQVKGKE